MLIAFVITRFIMISETLKKRLKSKSRKLLKAEITEAVSKIEDKEKLITLWYLIRQNGL